VIMCMCGSEVKEGKTYVCFELTIRDSEDLASGDVAQRPAKDNV
jgi:hypothetical protein